MATIDNTTARKRTLDFWMRNLTPEMRRAMKLLGISKAEYRRRLEQQLFGPLVTVSDRTEPISPEHKPVTWKPWPEVTCWSTDTILYCPEYTGLYITNR